jgi:hypothetical protein
MQACQATTVQAPHLSEVVSKFSQVGALLGIPAAAAAAAAAAVTAAAALFSL